MSNALSKNDSYLLIKTEEGIRGVGGFTVLLRYILTKCRY